MTLGADDPFAPAVVEVTEKVITEKALPISFNLNSLPNEIGHTPMRNLYAQGRCMLAIKERSIPTLAWKADYRGSKDQPLIGVYAFWDEKDTYSAVVLSRKLDGKHDGRDFGDGHTPVTLKMPLRSPRSIQLYRLKGDPRASNIDAMVVDLEGPMDIPPKCFDDETRAFEINERTGGGKGGIPPGSVYLYVFKGGIK
jgi:hypothetical protein